MSSRIVVVFIIVCSLICGSPVRAQQFDLGAEIARAEALLNGSQFQKAVDLLLDLDKRVQRDPEANAERVKINLLLGLSYLRLNQTSQARAKFVEVCTLDDSFTLSPDVYASRVTRVFDDAKKTCKENRCSELCVPGANGKTDSAKAEAAGCSCSAPADTSSIAVSIANTYKQGKELYDEGRYEDAVKYFDIVLTLDSTHELAAEYEKLAKQHLELGRTRSISAWRVNFNAQQYDKAAAEYAKIVDGGPEQKPITDEIEAEYDKVLGGLVQSWQTACQNKQDDQVAAIRKQAVTIAAGLPFTQGRLRQMSQCATKGCVYQEPKLALVRARTRVTPRLDADMRRFVPRQLRVSIVIDEKGNVTMNPLDGVMPRLADAVKTAVEQWKFYPAIFDNEPRCIETEIVFDFSLQ